MKGGPMAGLCKAILIGHLGRDPEIRYTPDGLAVANFSLAATEKVKGEDRTEWFRIVAFGRLGEICGQYLSKGKQVYVEGRFQSSEWEDRDGNKRFSMEVIASTIQMLGKRGDFEGQGGSSYQERPAQPQSQSQGSQVKEPEDDDIPF